MTICARSYHYDKWYTRTPHYWYPVPSYISPYSIIFFFMSLSVLMTKSRIFTPIIFGVTLLIAVLALRPVYMTYVEKNVRIQALEKDYTKLETELNLLKNIKENMSGALSPEKQARIAKLQKPFSTSDIMSIIMLSSYTKNTTTEPAAITLSNVSVNPGKKLPNGLSLASVGISLQGKSIANIINYITSLTQDSPYIFTLDSISLPIDTAPEDIVTGGYALSISLGVYYYE